MNRSSSPAKQVVTLPRPEVVNYAGACRWSRDWRYIVSRISYAESSPIRSSNASGPMGCPQPNRIAAGDPRWRPRHQRSRCQEGRTDREPPRIHPGRAREKPECRTGILAKARGTFCRREEPARGARNQRKAGPIANARGASSPGCRGSSSKTRREYLPFATQALGIRDRACGPHR